MTLYDHLDVSRLGTFEDFKKAKDLYLVRLKEEEEAYEQMIV